MIHIFVSIKVPKTTTIKPVSEQTFDVYDAT